MRKIITTLSIAMLTAACVAQPYRTSSHVSITDTNYAKLNSANTFAAQQTLSAGVKLDAAASLSAGVSAGHDVMATVISAGAGVDAGWTVTLSSPTYDTAILSVVTGPTYGSPTMRFNGAGEYTGYVNAGIFNAGVDMTTPSFTIGVKTVATDYAFAYDGIVQVDATSATTLITLPSPSSVPGKLMTVMKKDSSGNAVVITNTVGALISGKKAHTNATQYAHYTFYSDGTNYFVK